MPHRVTSILDIAVKAATRPTLMFDIDGILGFLTETTVTALNAHFGSGLVVSDMDDYWLEDTLPAEQGDWLEQLFAEPVTYANVAPDYAGISAVQAVHQAGYETVVSSDRPPAARAATEAWLEKWRVPYDDLVLDGKGGKLAVARQHGPDDPLILFDDDPRKMDTIPAAGVELWTPERPWTPDPPYPDGVWVFPQWAAVLERLDVDPDVPVPQFSRTPGPGQAAKAINPS